VTGNAAGVVVPGIGGIRASRWARRGTADAGGGTDGTADTGGGVAATGGGVPEGMSAAPVADSHVTGRQWSDTGVGGSGGRAAPPLPLSPQGGAPASGPSAGWARTGAAGTGTGRPAQPPVRQGGAPAPTSRPPTGSWPGGSAGTRSDSSNGSGGGSGKPPAAPFWARSRRRPK
jgi:hypothetical protein